jgi:hypothetical protein
MKAHEVFISPTLFLDCDGVLADFDHLARRIFGMEPKAWEDKHGAGPFWKTLRDYRDPATGHGFFRSPPLMPDARKLFDAVAHLKPVILTGCPFGKWAEPQKMAWAEEHFPGTKMITCMARDKIAHLENPGDVLVDDKTKFQAIWEEGGGIFVHHTDAESSIAQLREIYPIWFQRTDRWTPKDAI